VQIFNADTDAANAVATNKVDAWASDYPFCKEYVDRNPSQFKLGPEPPIVQPWGIAVAKTNTQLAQRLTSVVKNLYATGWMQRLLAKYHFSDIALKNLG
jgi:ABC-type amino acid transport substrate-binding protein